MNARFDDWEGEHLAHYGVLGMKWGQRRYQNKDGSLTAAGEKHYQKTGEYGYHYHSHATKKYQRKAARAEKRGNLEKAAKYKQRAKRSAEIDKGEQEYAKNISTGKALALTMLTSGNTMKGYAQYRAMAGQKGKEFTGQKAMAGIKAYNAGAYGSRMAKAAYIRQDEKKKTVGKTLAGVNKKVTDIGANVIDNLTKPVGDAYRKNKKRKR